MQSEFFLQSHFLLVLANLIPFTQYSASYGGSYGAYGDDTNGTGEGYDDYAGGGGGGGRACFNCGQTG